MLDDADLGYDGFVAQQAIEQPCNDDEQEGQQQRDEQSPAPLVLGPVELHILHILRAEVFHAVELFDKRGVYINGHHLQGNRIGLVFFAVNCHHKGRYLVD